MNYLQSLKKQYNICKNCNARTKCCASPQIHRTITEYGSEIEKQEYKDEYAKRSGVERPFGIFKEHST